MAEDKMYIVRSFKVFLLLGFISAHAAVVEETTTVSCLDGWTKIHRGCYKFVTDVELSWTEARDKCKEESAELVVILSVSEKDLLQLHLIDKFPEGRTWWAGLNREETSGPNWRWLDGEAVIVQNTPWANTRAIARPGEFSGTLEIKSNKLVVGVSGRSNPKPYICEYHSITPRPKTETTTELPIQDAATAPIDRVDPTLVKEPSEPAITARTESTHSPSAKSNEEGRKRTDPSSASGKLTQKHSSLSTTALTKESTTTATTTTTSTTSTTVRPTTPLQTAESSHDTYGVGKGLTKWPHSPSTPSTTTSTTPASTSSTTTATTTRTTPSTTTRTTSKRRTTSTPRTTPRPTPEQAAFPTPAAVDWSDAFRPYDGCYISVTGSSLMQVVLTARELYTDGSRHCPPLKVGAIDWPKTAAGQTATVKCQKGEGYATWTCSGQNITCWRGSPETTDCASKKLKTLLKKISEPDTPSPNATQTAAPPTVDETISVTSELLQVTRSENTTREDVLVTSKVITKLTETLDNVQDVKKKDLDTIVGNVVKVGSSLVSEEKAEVWENMAPEDKVSAAATLLVAIETAMLSTVGELTEPTVIQKKEDNIELKLEVVDVKKLAKDELVYESESDSATVSIPKETLLNFSDGTLTKAVFITHYSMSSLLGGPAKKKSKSHADKTKTGGVNEGDKQDRSSSGFDGASEDNNVDQDEAAAVELRPRIASHILSASLGTDGHIRKLPKPITFTMKLTQEMEYDQIALCSFWNTSGGDNLGFWSQDGCQIVVAHSNKSHTTCQCDHMTSFAILLDVHGLKLSQVHQSLLNLVTIIGCVISCTALLASWVTFQCFSSLQGERNSIHKNLVVCLLVAEIIFVAGIDQYEYKILCSLIAGFLHFFFLAAFTWMFLEGLHIIFMLVQVFDSSRSRLPYYYFTGYGVPLIVVSASCLFYYEGYGTDDYCWLKQDRYFIWAFAGPVALILLVNALFLAYALSTVCRHSEYVFSSKDKTTGSGIRAWIQGALALEILLGLTWTLGYFFISDASIPMAYIFSIANSLQGLFIFIFHCLLNKKAQKEYRSVVHSVVSRSSSSVGTHSTLTKRSNQHSHELNPSYHQRLTNTNSHSVV